MWSFQAGQMESRKVVLVTAAAGGTGQFAVQVYFCLWRYFSMTRLCCFYECACPHSTEADSDFVYSILVLGDTY